VESIGVDPRDILFLTDNILECQAAREAGLETVNISRPGNADVDASV
jgi:methionine salvage enolase-phosphatase E1